MISTTSNKGFQMIFANGNTVSVQWGPMNYCEPTDDRGRNAPFDAPANTNCWGAKSAEVAAWNSDGEWHNFGGDQVKGWLTAEEVAEFISFVSNNNLDTSNPWADPEEE
jgi:hypothetical protein